MRGNKDIVCVDFHTHPVPPIFRQAMSELGIDPVEEDGFPLPAWSVEEYLLFMKEANIDYSVLSAPVPHIYNGDNEKARRAAGKVNDEVASIVKNHPNRFGFAGLVPLPDVEGAILETAHVMDELGALGMKVATNMGGVYLGDKRFDPLMEEWDRRKMLVIIHPCRARLRPENVITGKVAAIYEYPADTTRAVLNMMANRIMTRYPNIKWIVPHCGSFLPYMLQRFTGVFGILTTLGMMESVDVKSEFEKLYFDIAGDHPLPTHLNMLRMVAEDSHIVYGTDYPHSPANVILKKKEQLDTGMGDSEVLEKIYRGNAKTLLDTGED